MSVIPSMYVCWLVPKFEFCKGLCNIITALQAELQKFFQVLTWKGETMWNTRLAFIPILIRMSLTEKRPAAYSGDRTFLFATNRSN